MTRLARVTPLALLAFACGDNLNVPPDSPDVTLTTSEDTALRIELDLADANGDEVTVAFNSLPASGTLDPAEPIYLPDRDFNGTDAIRYVASDGLDSGTGTITIVVEPVNDAPTISAIANLTTTLDTPVLIPFGIDDIDTAIGELRTAASSSDEAVVPELGITLGGEGKNRDVLLTPAATGQTTITVFALDGEDVANREFVLTVEDVPPG